MDDLSGLWVPRGEPEGAKAKSQGKDVWRSRSPVIHCRGTSGAWEEELQFAEVRTLGLFGLLKYEMLVDWDKNLKQ